ncbi:MAG: Asp-tRNA(Asn)/Glu-tRNA(Gln) amidotransferase subunit GatB [Chloroflexi bacterium]|nr:Asp-tRNA(Asn)/Glu-tRNA(Gln) amidotransferase subunit GatB [Chloroflexota bacterium]
MEHETIIGLEVHTQLLTRSKMFCRCSADYASAPPNSHVCPVCLGMPGVLPTINRKAIEYAVMTALALQCRIPEFTKFDRKNYPYPDLMKGYQISQYDAPIGVQGWMLTETAGEQRRVNIKRVHLEEDVAKLIHRTDSVGESYSLIDVNRAGVPLMEIVTEPDLRSPEEARQFLMKLRTILQYLGVSTGNMEEGSFRCDANVSIRPEGSADTLAKVEVKNMNSFKAVYRALEFEASRQRKVAAERGRLYQETRGWADDKGVTQPQRSKEYAQDYRYFPEPDLPPLTLSPAWVDELRASLPGLPEARRDQFASRYALPEYDARLLAGSKALADYFGECMKAYHGPAPEKRAKTVSNWLLGEFARWINAEGMEIHQSRVTPPQLVELVEMCEQNALTGPAAKAVFEEMFRTGHPPREIAARLGLTQISDLSAVEAAVKAAIAANAQAVVDFRAGKQQSLTFLVGQVMKATRGRANPGVVTEILRRELETG